MRFTKTTFIILVGIMFFATMGAAEEVTIVTGEWAPFISKQLPGNGPHTEVVVAAYKAAGIETKVKLVPWKRALKELKEGTSLCSHSWGQTDKRKEFANFSVPLFKSRDVFIFLKSKLPNFEYTSLDALKAYKVAGLAGYSHVEKFKKAGLKLDMSSDLATALKKLKLGRVDLVCEDDAVVIDMIKKKFAADKDNFGLSKNSFASNDMFMMFSKTAPDSDKYREKFNAGVAKIKADGTYDAIMAKLK